MTDAPRVKVGHLGRVSPGRSMCPRCQLRAIRSCCPDDRCCDCAVREAVETAEQILESHHA